MLRMSVLAHIELCVKMSLKWYGRPMQQCFLSRSRFTPCIYMSMKGGLSVTGDCQCSYTGIKIHIFSSSLTWTLASIFICLRYALIHAHVFSFIHNAVVEWFSHSFDVCTQKKTTIFRNLNFGNQHNGRLHKT